MQQFELTHEFLSQLEELIDAGNKTEVSKTNAGLHPCRYSRNPGGAE